MSHTCKTFLLTFYCLSSSTISQKPNEQIYKKNYGVYSGHKNDSFLEFWA